MGSGRSAGGHAVIGLRRWCIASALAALSVSGCSREPALAGGYPTPVAAASAAVAALDTHDEARLRAMALTEAEFRTLVWPRLPAARPERNIPWQYAWDDLRTKSELHLRARLSSWKAGAVRVVEVVFDGPVTEYGTYRVHRDSRLRVADPAGQVTDVRIFGSVIEQGGVFKVFSFVVD